MEKPLWKIEGFITAAGNPVVQSWYWDEIGIEERDAIRDRMKYLVNVKKNLWMEPRFKWFGDIGEVRKSLRILPRWPACVCLSLGRRKENHQGSCRS